MALHSQNEKLVNEQFKLKAAEDETNHQIRKLAEGVRDYELRGGEINNKLIEVKSFINELNEIIAELKDRLRGYETKNGGLGDEIDVKAETIDNLERTFNERHETIKNQVEMYIELQHKNEKAQKETKHRVNLIRIENEKAAELSSATSKSILTQKGQKKSSTSGIEN